MTLSPVIVHVQAQSITDPHLSVPQFLLLILLLFLLRSFPFAPSLPTNGPAAIPFSDLEYYQSFDRRTETFSAAICNFNGSYSKTYSRGLTYFYFRVRRTEITKQYFYIIFIFILAQIFSTYKKCVQIQIS